MENKCANYTDTINCRKQFRRQLALTDVFKMIKKKKKVEQEGKGQVVLGGVGYNQNALYKNITELIKNKQNNKM